MLLLLAAATSTVTFGTSGFVLGDKGRFNAIALDAQGRAVAAGYTEGAIIARYLPDGRADRSLKTRPIPNARFSGVAIDRSGRIVAAGTIRDRTLIARFLPDGSLDESFGEYGLARGHRSRSFLLDREGKAVDRFHSVAIDSKDRIVAVGVARGFRPSAWSSWFFCRWFDLGVCWSYENTSIAARFLQHGPLDPSFAGTGFVLGNGGARWHAGPHDELIDLIVEGDRITAVGWAAGETYDDERTVVVRHLADGSLDRSFAGSGFIVSGPESHGGGSKEVLYGVGRHGDRLITCGFSFDTERHIRALIKIYRDDGELGHMIAPARRLADSDIEYFAKCAIDAYGRIVGAGFTDDEWAYTDEPDRALVARYRTDGSLGESFTSFQAGRSVFASKKNDGFYDVAIDREGRIWTVGSASGFTLIARFRNDVTLDAAR